ncbi:MAG: hypothetical protein AAGI71_17795 [Bacteroidota bacterium]
MYRLASTLLFLTVLLPVVVFAQSSPRALTIKASAGIGYGLAFEWAYDDAFDGIFTRSGSSTYSGTTLSVYGDLVLMDRVIGRAQALILNVGSVDEDDLDIDGSFLATGALGYSFFGASTDRAPRTFHMPVLLAAGYGRVIEESDTDASAHFGVIVSPHYYLTRHLAIEVTYHYLPGRSINGSSSIGAQVFTFGLRASL